MDMKAHEKVFVDLTKLITSLPASFECAICKKLVEDPVALSCTHLTCKHCLVTKKLTKCPSCLKNVNSDDTFGAQSVVIALKEIKEWTNQFSECKQNIDTEEKSGEKIEEEDKIGNEVTSNSKSELAPISTKRKRLRPRKFSQGNSSEKTRNTTVKIVQVVSSSESNTSINQEKTETVANNEKVIELRSNSSDSRKRLNKSDSRLSKKTSLENRPSRTPSDLDPFDSLINSPQKVAKRQYTRKKKEQDKESEVQGSETSACRERIVKWLIDSKNDFENRVFTQGVSCTPNVSDVDLLSISQNARMARKRTRCVSLHEVLRRSKRKANKRNSAPCCGKVSVEYESENVAGPSNPKRRNITAGWRRMKESVRMACPRKTLDVVVVKGSNEAEPINRKISGTEMELIPKPSTNETGAMQTDLLDVSNGKNLEENPDLSIFENTTQIITLPEYKNSNNTIPQFNDLCPQLEVTEKDAPSNDITDQVLKVTDNDGDGKLSELTIEFGKLMQYVGSKQIPTNLFVQENPKKYLLSLLSFLKEVNISLKSCTLEALVNKTDQGMQTDIVKYAHCCVATDQCTFKDVNLQTDFLQLNCETQTNNAEYVDNSSQTTNLSKNVQSQGFSSSFEIDLEKVSAVEKSFVMSQRNKSNGDEVVKGAEESAGQSEQLSLTEILKNLNAETEGRSSRPLSRSNRQANSNLIASIEDDVDEFKRNGRKRRPRCLSTDSETENEGNVKKYKMNERRFLVDDLSVRFGTETQGSSHQIVDLTESITNVETKVKKSTVADILSSSTSRVKAMKEITNIAEPKRAEKKLCESSFSSRNETIARRASFDELLNQFDKETQADKDMILFNSEQYRHDETKSDEELFTSDEERDVIEGTPESSKPVGGECMDQTIAPPAGFEDVDVNKTITNEDAKTPAFSLSPIEKAEKRRGSGSQLHLIANSTPKTGRQMSIKKFISKPKPVHVGKELFKLPSSTKPRVTCTRFSEAQLISIRLLESKTLIDYSSELDSRVTHLIVLTDEDNCVQDHTIKYVRAIAAGIWIVNYNWIKDCLSKNTIISEEAYEVSDITGFPGPRESRLSGKSKPLLKGYSIYCAPPFLSATQEIFEEIVRKLGGNVVSHPMDLLNFSEHVCLILAEKGDSSNTEQYQRWLEMLNVATVEIEWLSSSIGQFKVISFRRYILFMDEAVCTTRYPPFLLENVLSSCTYD